MRALVGQLGRSAAMCLALAAIDVSAQDVKDWLDRMHRAVEELNYEGTFVRVLDGNAETLRVVHRNLDGVVTKRISSLDGRRREILQHGERVQVTLPDREIVLLGAPSDANNPLVSALPNLSAAVDGHYELKTYRKGQVALRDTQIVIVNPRDEFRYGYRLWLDLETAMPLKTQTRDETGAVVEQIFFTEFESYRLIPDQALLSQVDTNGFKWIEAPRVESDVDADVTWAANRLPAGFELLSAKRKSVGGGDGTVDHLVYSDGLATVSVFVADSQAEVNEGFSRYGSTNAYSLVVGEHMITAMGEVPRMTVQRIATSLSNSR